MVWRRSISFAAICSAIATRSCITHPSWNCPWVYRRANGKPREQRPCSVVSFGSPATMLRCPSTGLHGCRLQLHRPANGRESPRAICYPGSSAEDAEQQETQKEMYVMTSPIAGGVDCDLHPAVPHLTSLLPYLNDYWRDQVTTRGMTDLVSQSYPPHSPITSRPDWRPAKGKARSHLEEIKTHALDPFGTAYGICNPLFGVQLVFSEDMADAFCRALNDWLVEQWLDKEPRLRGSIVLPGQGVEESVAKNRGRARG